ncbi:MAG: cellobiose phosphorylase, partial [Candidatus Omnitrophota bacterium]
MKRAKIKQLKKGRPIYTFIDDKGTFIVKNPHFYPVYFPLTDKDGTLLSSISPNLGGDIKKNNDQFLIPPASIEDIRSNLLCRRDFFIKTNRNIIRASLPHKNDVLEAGFLYHKLIKKVGFLSLEIINFIPHDLAVEVMWVKVKNTGKKPISISPTSFIPLYGRGEKSLRDHRHVSSLLNRIELSSYGITLTPTMVFDEEGHRANKTSYYVLGYENNTVAIAGQFPTLDSFCGKGDLISPDALASNLSLTTKYDPSFDGKEVCGALRFKNKKLNPGKEANYVLVLGIENDKRKIKSNFTKLNTPQKVEHALENTKKYWQGYLSRLDFDFQDKNFNNWLRWVKLQPTLRKLFGCSFLPHFDYGKGGRGWRDL